MGQFPDHMKNRNFTKNPKSKVKIVSSYFDFLYFARKFIFRPY